MAFDLERARLETPGCEKVLHFNNAGAALMPKPVLDAVIGHLERESEIGGYEAAALAHDSLEKVYDLAARLINCRRDEIAVLDSATRAWDMVFYSLSFEPGDRILTCMAEYASNFIAYLQVARKTGVSVEIIPNDEQGQVSVQALREAVDGRVKLIAITHVPTNGGLVNPATAVGEVARDAGILYLLDACQSVGQIPIDVKEIGCHMLSATGRKFLRGPRGTGILYVDAELVEQIEPPFLDLHAAQWVSCDRFEIRSDARRFESWEANYAARIGLGTAIDYALQWGLESIRDRVTALAEELRSRIGDLRGVTVHDLGSQRCGIVSFTVKGKEPKSIHADLARQRINVSISPAHFTRLDMDNRGLSAVLRASVHYYNSEEEIDRFCKTLATLVQ